MKNRQKSNQELVAILAELVTRHPTERFHQILRNYGFIKEDGIDPDTHSPKWLNEFNQESEVVLERVKEVTANASL
jgi:hypothetical protein